MLCSHVITLLMIAIKGRVSLVFRVAIRWNQSHMAPRENDGHQPKKKGKCSYSRKSGHNINECTRRSR